MKRLGWSVLLAAVVLPSLAMAETFKLPDEKPVVSVTIPKTWNPEAYEDGVEACSADEEVYIAIEATEADSVQKGMDEAFKYLKDKGVKVDIATAKKNEMKLNGMNVVDISWEGKDEDGPCTISLSVISVTDDQGLLLIYWASPTGEKENQDALSEIAQSIRPLK